MNTLIHGIIFDIDGCLARGRQAIPGAPETLQELRRRGMRVAFLTNDNQRTTGEWVQRLEAMGIAAEPNEILTSAVIAAEFVREQYAGRRVLPIGAAGLITALQERGITLVEQPEEAEVVVMGRDPDFNQATLNLACQAIWRGAAFVATNLDRRVPVADGFKPASGPMIKAVAWATGVEPIVMGKPSRWAGEMAMKILGIDSAHGAVAGDQLDQDIKMGKVAGLRTILVLTGSTRREDVDKVPPEDRPDVILPDVTHIPGWLDSGEP
ncbi:MAG: HAD-IIA family hydrolase [Chloroflexi bacterium]|nr:MAG: HAD-IIA family hydrolase [Chloroflexota bacterium]